jgi:hypothetical protein
MNREEIISAMVKSRECCRQIVQLYESVREDGDMTKGSLTARRNSLDRANASLSQMLLQMKKLPDKPVNCFTLEDDKRYVSSLFSEISELLEKAMILEREVRSSVPDEDGSSGRVHGARCIKAYTSG